MTIYGLFFFTCYLQSGLCQHIPVSYGLFGEPGQYFRSNVACQKAALRMPGVDRQFEDKHGRFFVFANKQKQSWFQCLERQVNTWREPQR